MTVETIAMFAGNVGPESRDNMRRKEDNLWLSTYENRVIKVGIIERAFENAPCPLIKAKRQKELTLATAFQNLTKFYGGVEKCLI